MRNKDKFTESTDDKEIVLSNRNSISRFDEQIAVRTIENEINKNKPWRLVIKRKIANG